MTLRSLSAWDSCLWVAAPVTGGKADTGLGESEEDEEEEDDDMGHSSGFMSWRLRQKAVTCSVLCGAERRQQGCSLNREMYRKLLNQRV